MFIRNDAPDSPGNLLWRNVEKIVLSLLAFLTVSTIVYDAACLSDRVDTKYRISGLVPTFWSDSRKADLNDGQLRSFRSNLPLLVLGAVLFVLGKRLWQRKLDYRSQLQFYAVTGIGACLYLHGPGVLYLLVWLLSNYAFAGRFQGTKHYALAVWGINLSFLVLTEYYDGYGFGWLGLHALDKFHPEMAWYRTSNLCFLKLISFLMDSHWNKLNKPTQTKEVTTR